MNREYFTKLNEKNLLVKDYKEIERKINEDKKKCQKCGCSLNGEEQRRGWKNISQIKNSSSQLPNFENKIANAPIPIPEQKENKKVNIEIKINEKIIEFTYYYKFKEKGIKAIQKEKKLEKELNAKK